MGFSYTAPAVSPPAGAPVGALNGTTIEGGNVVLGNVLGGAAAQLINNREIKQNGNNLAFTGTGNVGFGIQVPTFKVDVAGDQRIENSVGNNVLFISGGPAGTNNFIRAFVRNLQNGAGSGAGFLAADHAARIAQFAIFSSNHVTAANCTFLRTSSTLALYICLENAGAQIQFGRTNAGGTYFPNGNVNNWGRFYNGTGNFQVGTDAVDHGPKFQVTGTSYHSGNAGFGFILATAFIHVAGSAAGAAGTGSIKIEIGVPVAVVENGLIERNANNLTFSTGGVRYVLAKTLGPASAILDFPNTLAGTSSDLTINLPGAVVGDRVDLGVDNASVVANGCFTAWVSAPGVVTVRFLNNDLLLPFDPAPGTFTVSVTQ